MLGQIHPEADNGRQEKFSGAVTRLVALMMGGALVLAALGLYWATYESDRVSVERQSRSVHHAIQTAIDELALEQETVAIWDEAARQIITRNPDTGWIHENVGGWLHKIFRQSEVFVLDTKDRPIYAAVGSRQVSSDRYRAVSREMSELVTAVRGQSSPHSGQHDRLPERKLSSRNTVRTTARAIHDSHLRLIGGRPAAVSAMLVQPSSNLVKWNGPWPILISVRYIDGNFLSELGARQLIAEPRFSRSSRRHAGEHSIPLKTQAGDVLGFLFWKPDLPGSRILWKLVPLTALFLTALAAFIALIGRKLRVAGDELATAEAQAAHIAFHDSLTGLPNRASFQHRLDQLTSPKNGESESFALLLLDVDDFKLTNDTLGHDAGDALLQIMAERLRKASRPTDLVARLGGDEFALLLPGIGYGAAVAAFADRLLSSLRESFEYSGRMIECCASVGASLRLNEESGADILKAADLALYASKNAGRGVFRLYHPSMRDEMLARSGMLSLARRMLDDDCVRPFYQAKVDLRTNAVVGFEALLRCCPPVGSAFGPERLTAAFEDSTLAVQLSDRMIERVIEDIACWRALGLQFGHVAINAGGAELRHGEFAERLIRKLRLAGLPPDCLQIEITESVLLGRGVEHVERTLRTLSEEGIKLALDDFGTGFASLSHLKQYPVEVIKIDRTFVRELQVDPEDGAIVDAILGLAQSLNIQVVAEGIETRAQRDFLAALGCGVGQGYLFGHAVPAEQVPGMFLRQPSRIRAAA